MVVQVWAAAKVMLSAPPHVLRARVGQCVRAVDAKRSRKLGDYLRLVVILPPLPARNRYRGPRATRASTTSMLPDAHAMCRGVSPCPMWFGFVR